VAEQHPRTKLVFRAEAVICRRKLLDRGKIKRVALVRAVDADHQDVPVALDCDSVWQGFSLLTGVVRLGPFFKVTKACRRNTSTATFDASRASRLGDCRVSNHAPVPSRAGCAPERHAR
jgi:hypothetical protein